MKKTIMITLAALMIMSLIQIASARETPYSWGKDRDEYGCMASKGQVYCARLTKCINPKYQSCDTIPNRGKDWYSGTKTLQTPTLRVIRKEALGADVWGSTPSTRSRDRKDKPIFVTTGKRAGTIRSLAGISPK